MDRFDLTNRTLGRRDFLRLTGQTAALAAGGLLAGCGGGNVLGQGDDKGNGTRRVEGESQQVAGSTVSSWAVLNADGSVAQAGVTFPVALAQNQPTQAGTGPAGALAVLEFPSAVRSTTFFDHFELHSVPMGHPPAVYTVPHFDLHFYAIPEAQVRLLTPPDPVAPAANRVPAGWVYPGTDQAVPEMGVHAVPAADLAQGATFSASMVLGYYNGQMHFLEPMITVARLMTRQTFSLPVPQPTVLGRTTRLPRRFTATYNASSDSYALVFDDFVPIT